MLITSLLVCALMLGCSDQEEGQFTILHTVPGKEACARLSEPTAELDSVKERLGASGYRVRYSGYSALGFFADGDEQEEVCADSALTVSGGGLGRFEDVHVRQYSDPAALERTVAQLSGPETVLIERESLLYFSPQPHRAKLEQLIDEAER